MSSAAAKPREWSPRLWEGCDYFAWLRILIRNRFAVTPRYWYIAAIISVMTVLHTLLRWRQHALYGHRIAATRLPADPIFVVGHWRTGTTLLHELLILDPRFNCPDTAECFLPTATLLTERFFKQYLWFLMPSKRPMDNMAAGWDRPQEDEFALCLLGHPSPYADIAFPGRPPLFPGSLDLSGLTPRQLHDWKRGLVRFLQTLTLRDPRRLVLKSPPHTARVPVLLDLFPNAKFVHIVRDPRVVFPSTVHLWKSMAAKHGLRPPVLPGVEEKVYSEFEVLYRRLEEAKPRVPAGQFYELRYEDLTRDPAVAMEKLYAALGLGGFADYRPRLDDYLGKTRGYETNKYQLTPGQKAEVERRCGDVIRRYGYG
jgi:hypothetical protein